MAETEESDYKEAADYAKELENYLGNFAAGIRFRTDRFPDDIKHAFRGIAGEVRDHAEKLGKLSEEYQRKSKVD